MERLQHAERAKTEQEVRLSAMKTSIETLGQNIHREEAEGTRRLQEELARFAQQRAQLECVLAAQTASVEELARLVEAVPPAAGSPVAAAEVHVDPYDSTDMLRYLQQEIDTMEQLRAEAATRAARYTSEREALEARVRREAQQRQAQLADNALLERRLHDTVVAATEAAVLQATLEDVASERLFNLGRAAGGSSAAVSASSSRVATPRFRGESAIGGGRGVAALHMSLGVGASRSRSATAANTCSSTPLPEEGVAAAGGGGGGSLHNNNNTTVSLANCGASLSYSTSSPIPAGHRTSLIHVQDTTRMAAPRPLSSAECTPKKMPAVDPSLGGAVGEPPMLPASTLPTTRDERA
ncbi:hypothetical protein STCU_10219 [Strigomonas culicis]|uniref:Uncharacterized protein n=1 Tax=Strigomonas culicis TaxID=28005 RepID=S9TMT3_9TRYP|nr:hypothetical protein STCU_10219 [Strigomonas culicis]|eukprot:EPY18064.1 hypothetical protein STCU_10219 [Strigomonas culicis]